MPQKYVLWLSEQPLRKSEEEMGSMLESLEEQNYTIEQVQVDDFEYVAFMKNFFSLKPHFLATATEDRVVIVVENYCLEMDIDMHEGGLEQLSGYISKLHQFLKMISPKVPFIVVSHLLKPVRVEQFKKEMEKKLVRSFLPFGETKVFKANCDGLEEEIKRVMVRGYEENVKDMRLLM